MRRALVAIAAAGAVLMALAPASGARERYDVKLLARVPPPGQPALALVAPDRTIYVGTFTNSSGSPNGPSKVFAYTPEGQLKRTYTVAGQDPSANNGVQVAAIDARGTLYLLDQHPARVITLDPVTGAQATYATFKDVPTCAPPGVGNECSATLTDNPPEPDYAAWGTDGQLYVTDYTQGLIWRVPRGGGMAHVWFTDPQLDGAEFGPAGIVLTPDHHHLMFDTSAGGATGPSPTTGELYRIEIWSDGTAKNLEKIWESGPAEGPDGFALAKSGNVYMALVGPGVNQLVVIAPDGHEIARISHTASGDDDVPFDEPSSVAFDGERMIVTNDAYFSGDASHFALFDVFAAEPGEPVFVPSAATVRPARYALRVRPRAIRRGRRVTLRVRAFVTRNATGRQPLSGARVRLGRAHARTNSKGRARLRVRLRRPGRHTVRLVVARRTVAKRYVRVRHG